MSFIYDDPKLIEQLIKAALEHEKKFSKRGQVLPDVLDPHAPPNMVPNPSTGKLPPAQTKPGTPQETYRAYIEGLRQQLQSLQSQVSPPAKDPGAPPEVSTESDAKVKLQPYNVENLGALIEFLVRNAITVDGKRIAYQDGDTQDPSYQLYRGEGNAGQIESAQRADKSSFRWRVNKDLLVKYVQSLQIQQAKDPNAVLKAPLQTIVVEIKQQLGVTISEYKPPQPAGQPTQQGQRPAQRSQQQPGQQGQQGQQQPEQQSAQNVALTIRGLVDLRPFRSDNISIRNLLEFSTKYAALVGSKRPDMVSSANQIQTLVGQANQKLQTENQNIPTQFSEEEFMKRLCKRGSEALILANDIAAIITQAGNMYQDFANNYQEYVAKQFPDSANVMGQQLQVQKSNVTFITQITSLLPRVLK